MRFAWLFVVLIWLCPVTGFAQPAAESGTASSTVVQAQPPAVPAAAPVKTELARLEVQADWPGRVRSFFGLILMLLIAWAMSSQRRAVNFRLIITGVALQVALGLVALSPPGAWFFGQFRNVVNDLLSYTTEGASFLFGNLARQNNLPVGKSVIPPDAGNEAWVADAVMAPVAAPAGGEWEFVSAGAFFAFNVLPTIIFFSSLLAVLYHLGVMQLLVRGIAQIMQRTMRTSGAETLSSAGNIFVGQTEAPLLVRPFLATMTQSELMAVMTGGFATVAGGVMVAYVGMLKGVFPDIAGHLLCASIMSAPAALVIAKIIVPEPDPTKSKTYGKVQVDLRSTDANVIDAAARGAAEGLKLALNVGAMLLAFVALIALVNGIVGWFGALVGIEALSLQLIFGKLLSPLAWMMGVPWEDAQIVGSLLGVKTAVNEFVAYLQLAGAASQLQHTRSLVIATYALCGFANFSSIAIQIGGISPLAPERRSDLARLGLRAMIGGTLAAFTTACVIGMMI